MSFTFPNVFKQSKSRSTAQVPVAKDRQQQAPLPSSPSPPRSRTLSMASVQSVAARMTNTNYDPKWPSDQQNTSMDSDDLEENPFFIAFKSLPHISIFLRSALVCIPHTQSIVGLTINKRTLETHAFLPSPFYKGQYQSLNGKVVAIEKGYVTEVSGFQQLRTIRIISEETHYSQRLKITVLTIDRPLEGEIKHSEEEAVYLIPAWRNHKLDADFLTTFDENEEALKDANAAIQEFSSTYLFLKEYTAYAVEKILHIYTQLYQSLLSCNVLIKEACRMPKEMEHFQELVENYILGVLHAKIWHRFLPPYLGGEDKSIVEICKAYRHEITTLSGYGISAHLREMPISYLDAAVLCLRRLDSDNEMPRFVVNAEDGLNGIEDAGKEPELATTPIEKLMCIRTALSLISAAADKFMQENGLTVFHTSVASDDLITLLACSLAQTHLPRLMSTLFYVRHFRLNQVERPELSFALVTFTAAIEFLRKDELFLRHQYSTTPKYNAPYGFPRHNTSWSSLPNHYRSASVPERSSPESPPTINIPTTLPVAKTVQHRKSRSTDLGTAVKSISAEQQQQQTPTRRKSISPPNVTIKPQIVVPKMKDQIKPKLNNHTNFEHPKSRQEDWMLGDGKPMISTTSPTISSSTPITNSRSQPLLFPDDRPSSSSSSEEKPQTPLSPVAPRLERSLSAVSSRSEPHSRMRSPSVNQPPEIIRVSFDHHRPGPSSAGIHRRPVSMYASEQFTDSELMGDFLAGLQNDADYVGDRAGSFRRVSGRW
ncbi:hypothetical protein BGW37DRAFT_159307 [Umbelopsis sp. PMI_123]|nr:hypothetical protein BGW37DRAFT_159307 [Umbelopsis sp. PMI_123]